MLTFWNLTFTGGHSKMKTLEDKLAEQGRELNWVLHQLEMVRAKLESLENHQKELDAQRQQLQLQLEPVKGSVAFSPDYFEKRFEEIK